VLRLECSPYKGNPERRGVSVSYASTLLSLITTHKSLGADSAGSSYCNAAGMEFYIK